MKIAFLPDYYLPHMGGMQTWTLHMASGLAKRGHDVTVFTYKTPENRRDEEDDFVVRRLGYPPVRRPHSYFAQAVSWITGLPRILLRERFDAHLPTYSPLIVSKALGVHPLFPVWHGYQGLAYAVGDKGPLRGRVRYLVESVALNADVEGIVAVAEHLRKQLMDLNPRLHEERVHVVHGGVDPERFECVSDLDTRERVVFLGRMVTQKAPLDALKAFLLVRERLPDLEIVFIGSGPLRYALEKKVASLGDPDSSKIRILGRVSEDTKIDYLSSSRLLLVPSMWEAFPLGVLESLACGTPFVGYDIAALREIRELTGGGVVVPRGDVSSLAKELLGILESKREAHMASKGRRMVLRRFSWKNLARRLETVLSS